MISDMWPHLTVSQSQMVHVLFMRHESLPSVRLLLKPSRTGWCISFFKITFSLHAMQLHIEFISILMFVVVVIFGSAAAHSSLQTRHAALLSPPCGSESNYAGFALEKRPLSKQSLGGGLPDLYMAGFAAPVDSP